MQIGVEVAHAHHDRHPGQAQQYDHHGGHTAYKYIVALAHALFHGLIEIFREESGAAIEEGGQRSYQGANETNGHDTFHTSRQDIFHHHGVSAIRVVGVGNIHLDAATCLQGEGVSNHTRNQEHENRQQFEITCGDSTAASAFHHFPVVLSFGLSEHTLHDVLVSTPIPETDDGSSKEHYIAWELGIHGISGIGMEHVSGTETIMGSVADSHHLRPSCRNVAISQHAQSQEKNQERTDNQDRGLYGGKRHYAFHATKHGKHGSNGYQSKCAVPERNA